MAQYKNESLGVVNVGGQVVAPKATVELEDNVVGLAGMVKRGTLSKVDGRTKAAKTPSKTEDKE